MKTINYYTNSELWTKANLAWNLTILLRSLASFVEARWVN